MRHRISVGGLVLREGRLLLARHRLVGRYDFWAPPGGGVEGAEELPDAVEREVFEETGLRVRAGSLAYIDELIDDTGRTVKFWHLCEHLSGEIDVSANPAKGEAIVAAGWFERGRFPDGHVFPLVLRDGLWADLEAGARFPIKLPLQRTIF